jgi:hypothetical protein
MMAPASLETGIQLARPYLGRSPDSLIRQAERLRDGFYGRFAEACRERRVDANVLKSGPFTTPPWAAFEAYVPSGSDGVTRRLYAAVSVTPVPYHELPFEYAVTVRTGDRERSWTKVVHFTPDDAQQLVGELLVGVRPKGYARRRVRDAWWQLWRPRNRERGVRRDWFDVIARWTRNAWGAALGLVVLAVLATAGGVEDVGTNLLQLVRSPLITLALFVLLGASVWFVLVRHGRGNDTAKRLTIGGALATLLLEFVLRALGRRLDEIGALVLFECAAALFAARCAMRVAEARPRLTRTVATPEGEPRSLRLVDHWEALIVGLGDGLSEAQMRLLERVKGAPLERLRHHSEEIWYHGLDQLEVREQVVLEHGRGIVFVHVYRYGKDLFVGWDAHLNEARWVEQTLASGIDRATGELVALNTVVSGTQPNTEYDLIDLSTLIEWTHAQLVQVVKQLMEERRIDQEVDFTIQRGQRQGLVNAPAAPGEKAKTPLQRAVGRFRRTG